MANALWESQYIDAYDKVLLNSDIYLTVRDFHANAMNGCKKVLDSGCSTGNVTLELLKNGATVYAVDSSKKSLDILRQKCAQYSKNLHIYNINAEKLPFNNEFLDGVSSMFVAHFVDDFESYLKETYRVLKKGGALALTARTTNKDMEKIVESYRASLRERNLLPKLLREFDIVKASIINSVSKAVKNPHIFEEAKAILKGIGFTDIKEIPNPYFGQCYSLLAYK